MSSSKDAWIVFIAAILLISALFVPQLIPAKPLDITIIDIGDDFLLPVEYDIILQPDTNRAPYFTNITWVIE